LKYAAAIIVILVFLFFNRDKNHFHIENNKGAYKLVSPQGKAFFSLGVTHIGALTYPNSMPLFKNKYENRWDLAAKEIHKNLMGWEFNTAGYGAPKALRQLIPFMMPCQPLLKNSSWLDKRGFSYADVFDAAVQKTILDKLEQMTSVKDNPNLIGYYWTDMPMWNLKTSKEKFGTNWVEYIKNLPKNSAGRMRYEAYIKNCELNQGEPTEEDFLIIIAREYYQLIGTHTRKLDPNTLIFGERYAMNRVPISVLKEALPYIDVVSIQPNDCSFNKNYFRNLHQITKKPILICDHQCSFPTETHKHTMWKQLEDQTVAANSYKDYIEAAVKEPYLIGYHRCQYIDRYNHKNDLLKQGMVREDGTAYEPYTKTVTSSNKAVKAIFDENRHWEIDNN
tara:strand:+ start:217 stop:1395 length:1179 start_codon:yes stop_codon:yes gene_type:complete